MASTQMLLKGSEVGVLDDAQQEQLSFKLGKLQEAKDAGVQFDDTQNTNFSEASRLGLIQIIENVQTRTQEIRQEQDEAGLIQPPAQPLFDAIPDSVSDFIAKEILPVAHNLSLIANDAWHHRLIDHYKEYALLWARVDQVGDQPESFYQHLNPRLFQ